MVKVIEGDLLNTDAKIICHQVNCKGKMGSGVALQIKNRYPHVFEEYSKICSSEMLEKVQLVPVHEEYIEIDPGNIAIPSNEQYICNMFSQDSYGYDGQKYTSLEAIRKCFETVKMLTLSKNNLYGAKIAMPYKICCVRGGANWNEVYAIIEEVFKDCEVELWRLDKG